MAPGVGEPLPGDGIAPFLRSPFISKKNILEEGVQGPRRVSLTNVYGREVGGRGKGVGTVGTCGCVCLFVCGVSVCVWCVCLSVCVCVTIDIASGVVCRGTAIPQW